jgi:hypothetical protein
MNNLKQQLTCKILVAVGWGLLGPLGVFNSSAAAQTYMFGRADFAIAAPYPAELGEVATGDFNRDGIVDLAVAVPGYFLYSEFNGPHSVG